MVLSRDLSPEDRFWEEQMEEDGVVYLRRDVETEVGNPLDKNILFAMTMNDVACSLGHSFFYWIPSYRSLAAKQAGRRKYLKETDYENIDIKKWLAKTNPVANLLFLPDYHWTKDEQDRWQNKYDVACRQNLCQAQMNWWNQTNTLILPIYLSIQGPPGKVYSVSLGPREEAHNGAMILLTSTRRDTYYRLHLSTLQETRNAGPNSIGPVRPGPVYYRTFSYMKTQPAELLKWVIQWLDDTAIDPNTYAELILRLQALAKDKPDLLQSWDDAVYRIYT